MKRLVVAIRDRASDTFGSPYCVVALGQAIRSFSDEVNRDVENNPLCAHPEDFDLYCLGTYEDDTGLFDCGAPRQVAVGKDVKIRSNGSNGS